MKYKLCFKVLKCKYFVNAWKYLYCWKIFIIGKKKIKKNIWDIFRGHWLNLKRNGGIGDYSCLEKEIGCDEEMGFSCFGYAIWIWSEVFGGILENGKLQLNTRVFIHASNRFFLFLLIWNLGFSILKTYLQTYVETLLNHGRNLDVGRKTKQKLM